MGRWHALEAIRLRKTERIPKWIGVPFHPEFLEKLTGIDPFSSPQEASIRAIEQLELDVADYFEVVRPTAGSESEVRDVADGKITAFYPMAVQGLTGGETLWQDSAQNFHSVEDVLNYDVTQHQYYKKTEQFEEELKAGFAKIQEHRLVLRDRAWVPDPVSWYNTVFMWGVTTFGWEPFLMTAALEPKRYSLLLDRFTEITQRYFTAAARLDGLIVAQAHDDLCMTQGPVFNPKWYRDYIFPRYPKLLTPLKKRGVKVIYRGDGNISEFVDDLMAAGFDGLFVRSETDIASIARKYGSSKVILGNINTAILTFKGKREIEEEIKRCVKQAGDSPGYFLQIAGDLPLNVPTDNLFYLFEALKKYSRR